MDIYLIRHTKTATEPGLCYGRTDVALAESAAVEIHAVKSKLPEISDATRIFSSPSSRCTQLAAAFGIPFKTDERLLEIDFGLWENRRFEHLDQAQVKHWSDNFVTIAPPQGESFNGLCRRAADFWDELILLQNADQIILIIHAGVIRAMLAHVLQIPPANAFKFRVDAGSVHKLQHLNEYTYIEYLNRK